MESLVSQVLENGVVAGMFAMLLWWMTNRQEQMMRQIVRQISTCNLLIVGMQKMLLAHDLTVTGINPAAGEDVEERASTALRKYEEVRSVMDTIQQSIQAAVDDN